MRKRSEKKRSAQGGYVVSCDTPDRDVFKLRLEALRCHEGYNEYCARPDIKKIESEILDAWKDIPGWLSNNPGPYEKCLLIYGNYNKLNYRVAWSRYRNAYMNYQDTLQTFPFQELKPGTLAPEGRLNISIDPSLSRVEIIQMVERFITARRKSVKRTLAPDPIRGYFHITEKRFNPDLVRRVMAVYALREKHPQTWRDRAEKAFPEDYTGKEKTRLRKAYRDIDAAANIISWVVMGRFPCMKPFK